MGDTMFAAAATNPQHQYLTQFLSTILPDGGGAVVIEVVFPLKPDQKPGDKNIRSIRAFLDRAEAAKFALWGVSKGADVFHRCAGLNATMQSVKKYDGTSEDRLVAPAKIENFHSSRVFILDLDVKPGCYASQQEAIQHLAQFVSSRSLPPPTYLVNSGGGVHVYWVMDTPIENVIQHRTMAAGLAAMANGFGLKHDVGVAKNSVTLLRTPGTYNHKHTDNPRPTGVMAAGATLVPLAAFQAALGGYTISVVHTGRGSLNSEITDTTSARGPATAGEIVKYCAVLSHAAATNGADLGYDLWRKGVLATLAFTDDGMDFVHPLSDKYPTYSEAETDRQWADACRFAAEGGSPPTCASIESWGASAHCAKCAFKGRIVTPRALGEQGAISDPGDFLPRGYMRRNGSIWKVTQKATAEDDDDADDGAEKLKLVVPFDIRDVKICRLVDLGDWRATITVLNGTVRSTHILSFMEMGASSGEANRVWVSLGIPMNRGAYTRMHDLMNAFLLELQRAQQVPEQRSRAFGWITDDEGETIGFAHGGRAFMADGTDVAAQVNEQDGGMTKGYRPVGSAAVWTEVANKYIAQAPPEAQAIIAASFAAPLMKFSGQSGILLVAMSLESGTGKSTAMRIGQSIWGHPKQLSSLSDTEAAIMARLGILGHLPTFWDEVRLGESIDGFVDMVFRLGQGRGKGRLTSQAKLRETQSWETLSVLASNQSIADRVANGVGATDAGLNRVFEWVLPKASVEAARSRPGALSPVGMGLEVERLSKNYGKIGSAYATWLAQNHTALGPIVRAAIEAEASRYKFDAAQRFWATAVAMLRLGAALATKLGYCNFDRAGFDAWLDRAVAALTMGATEPEQGPINLHDDASLAHIIHQYVEEHSANYLVVRGFDPFGHYPPKHVFRVPQPDRPILITLSFDPHLLMFPRKHFGVWCRTRLGVSERALYPRLRDRLGMRDVRLSIAGPIRPGAPRQYAFQLAADSPLLSFEPPAVTGT